MARLAAVAALAIAAVAGPALAQPADAPGEVAPRLIGRPIDRIQFRGNRKVEADTIRLNLVSKVGTTIDAAKIRDDVKAMWRMGYFADVVVEAELAPAAARS
jgi:outer membrane protein assembly factor BamA